LAMAAVNTGPLTKGGGRGGKSGQGREGIIFGEEEGAGKTRPQNNGPKNPQVDQFRFLAHQKGDWGKSLTTVKAEKRKNKGKNTAWFDESEYPTRMFIPEKIPFKIVRNMGGGDREVPSFGRKKQLPGK